MNSQSISFFCARAPSCRTGMSMTAQKCCAFKSRQVTPDPKFLSWEVSIQNKLWALLRIIFPFPNNQFKRPLGERALLPYMNKCSYIRSWDCLLWVFTPTYNKPPIDLPDSLDTLAVFVKFSSLILTKKVRNTFPWHTQPLLKSIFCI